MDKRINIIKASGKVVAFDVKKLRRSLQKAGADHALVGHIVSMIEEELQENMSTKEIYKKAFVYLKNSERSLAARYSLKRAIHALGPAGYPFEKFIGRMLEAENYQVSTGLILKGKCINHEVDVYARNDTTIILAECKYHAAQGRKSDVKTALYFHARFNDLQSTLQLDHPDRQFYGYLVTNTRFSTDADAYGACAGIKMISWDKPENESLRERIERLGLHPITCMTTLTRHEKERLMAEDILLTQELLSNAGLLEKWGLTDTRRTKIIDESNQLSMPRTHQGRIT